MARDLINKVVQQIVPYEFTHYFCRYNVPTFDTDKVVMSDTGYKSGMFLQKLSGEWGMVGQVAICFSYGYSKITIIIIVIIIFLE